MNIVSNPHPDPRWATLAARESGAFFYGVRSTSIYCRPACPARLPRPDNVVFFDRAEAAMAAGFRPCKRCRPDMPSPLAPEAAIVTRACRQIETAETGPSLADLARGAGLSPTYFQRLFKRLTGITPKAYAQTHRAARVAGQLPHALAVTQALYDAGYASPGRFYAAAKTHFGMKPSSMRRRGQGEIIRYSIGPCSLGLVLAAATARGICAILLGEDRDTLVRDLERRFGEAELLAGDAEFAATLAAVVALADDPHQILDVPLDILGTAFQHKVWRALCDIPPGQTLSYAHVAGLIGEPRAVRAVAGACAANPVAIAIPCHRVVRADGSLSGYRWGAARKRLLLAREQGDGYSRSETAKC